MKFNEPWPPKRTAYDYRIIQHRIVKWTDGYPGLREFPQEVALSFEPTVEKFIEFELGIIGDPAGEYFRIEASVSEDQSLAEAYNQAWVR